MRAGQLSRRSMNFGQHWRTEGVEEAGCTVEIPLAFVAVMVKREHPSYVEDAQLHPSDDRFEAAQRERGWPSVEAMLAESGLLEMTADYYGPELLLEWLGDLAPEEAPGFVLNTVRFHACTGGAIVLAGRARRAGQPARYQDV